MKPVSAAFPFICGMKTPMKKRPPSPLSGLSGELGRLLRRFTRFELEPEDLMLVTLLYLLWRESGDEDFLFMLAGVLLL